MNFKNGTKSNYYALRTQILRMYIYNLVNKYFKGTSPIYYFLKYIYLMQYIEDVS